MHITISLTEDEVKCLKNDIIDIENWIQLAVKGKVSSCRDRIVSEWLPKLMEDENISTIPADKSLLINEIIKNEKYKNRVQIEEINSRLPI